MAKSNLIKLAKGEEKKTKNPVTKKPVEKVVEKQLTQAEERDIKAKETVDKLLDGVDLLPKKDDELLEMETEQPKSIDWLTEQIAALTTENELLKSELAVAKADYVKIFDENQRIKNMVTANPAVGDFDDKVLALFNELQNQYLKYPPAVMNETQVNVRYVLNKMCELFPFVNRMKRF